MFLSNGHRDSCGAASKETRGGEHRVTKRAHLPHRGGEGVWTLVDDFVKQITKWEPLLNDMLTHTCIWGSPGLRNTGILGKLLNVSGKKDAWWEQR